MIRTARWLILPIVLEPRPADSKADSSHSHNTWDNTIDLELLDNGDYLVTIIVDEGFLSHSETVYPVYIDPTLTVNVSGSGTSKTIIDVPMYNGSGAQNLASGANTFNLIGYIGTSGGVVYGVGRTLMKFPLKSETGGYYSFSGYSSNAITNVSLYIYESSGQSTSSAIVRQGFLNRY